MDSSLACPVCGTSCQTNGVLRRHYRLKHPDLEQPPSKRRKGRNEESKNGGDVGSKCSLCPKSFVDGRALRIHESMAHRNRVDTISILFPTVEDFTSWKRQEEDRVTCRFVKRGSSGRSRDGLLERRYYVCHRSGRFMSRSRQARSLKAQGSCKIGQKCTSFVNAKITALGFVMVRYCPLHIGHVAETTHLTMRREDRQLLAGYLAEGLNFNEVVARFERECSGKRILRPLTRQDLHNVARDFQLPRVPPGKRDALRLVEKIQRTRNPACKQVQPMASFSHLRVKSRPSMENSDQPRLSLEEIIESTRDDSPCLHLSSLNSKIQTSSSDRGRQREELCSILNFVIRSFDEETVDEISLKIFEAALQMRTDVLALRNSGVVEP